MERALGSLEELADVVEAEPWLERAQVARAHDKARALLPRRLTGQAAPKRRVDDVLEGAPAPPGLRFQPGGHVLVERERCAHILMLDGTHQDVNRID